MASRQASPDAYNWTHPQDSNPSVTQSVQLSSTRPYPPQSGSSYSREHGQAYMHSNAPNYMHSRQAPPAGGMTYGMPPPMQSHVQDPAAGQSGSSAYMSQPHLGQYGSSAPPGFAYGSQFYGGAQQPYAMSQQQQHYYGAHHAQMDPNGHGHPMYGSSGPMSPDILGPNGHYHHADAGTMGPGGYSGLQAVGVRPKRKQVKNACVNCQKACKKCDEGRPCGRCVKYGLTDTCQDSARKERRRGVKRGPYKRRATSGSQPNNSGAMGMPMGYGRGGHLSPSGTSSAPAETNLSSPGFGSQSLVPRPGMPMGMLSNASWQPSSSPSMRSVEDDRDGRAGRYMPHPNAGQGSYYSGYEGQEGGPSPYDRSSSAPIPGPGSLVLSPIGSLNRFQQQAQLPSLNGGSNRPIVSPSSGGFLNSGPPALAHHRLHSDSSLTIGTSSPRTPLNGQGGSDYALMSPPVKTGSYAPPQPTVTTTSSSFLSQEASSRPFPLMMPKVLQRPRPEERRSGGFTRGANSSLGLA